MVFGRFHQVFRLPNIKWSPGWCSNDAKHGVQFSVRFQAESGSLYLLSMTMWPSYLTSGYLLRILAMLDMVDVQRRGLKHSASLFMQGIVIFLAEVKVMESWRDEMSSKHGVLDQKPTMLLLRLLPLCKWRWFNFGHPETKPHDQTRSEMRSARCSPLMAYLSQVLA